jgi:hypothetical protein
MHAESFVYSLRYERCCHMIIHCKLQLVCLLPGNSFKNLQIAIKYIAMNITSVQKLCSAFCSLGGPVVIAALVPHCAESVF